VAPMYQPGTSRSVYLPAGSWIDWWDGGVFEGLQTIEADVPLDRMPIFVRSGAIIPMIRDDVDTLVPRTAKTDSTVKTLDDRRIIEVWPGATGSFQTSDGLSARLKRSGTKAMLEIESAEARRIEVRLLYRDLVNLQGGAVSRPDYQRRRSTVVSLGQTAGRQVLTWEEE